MLRLQQQFHGVLPHAVATAIALVYAWLVSQTPFFTTGLQFVSPVAVVIFVHLIWFALLGRLQPGFANRVFGQAALTAVFMLSVLILGSLFAPQPAYAEAADILFTVLVVVFCAAVIAVVIFIVVIVVYAFFSLLGRFARRGNGNGTDDEPPQSRMFDVGSLLVCALMLMVGSFEDVPMGYGFDREGQATSQHVIAADEATVWRAMQTATSPAFALPTVLAFFPQPVAVSVDEGVGLGANRVVDFAGREGAGALHLQVVEATDAAVLFEVRSDTTPYAGWIGYRALRYEVIALGDVTRLSVSLTYERKLAPAWFFDPVMKGASYLAMDVLARDVKARSER